MTRALAVLLVSTLIVPPASAATGSGILEGRVVTPQGSAAPKAVWAATAVNPKTPQRAAVDEKGAFRLDAVPAGAVELAVETTEGLYVVETPVTPPTIRGLWGAGGFARWSTTTAFHAFSLPISERTRS